MIETKTPHLQGPRMRVQPSAPGGYKRIALKRLTPVIGAEISGVSLADPIDDEQFHEIALAFAEFQVIFFRNQDLQPEEHLAFGRRFGNLHIHPAAPHAPGQPALMVIRADQNSPRANGEVWHSDVSCDLNPPLGSILNIKICPENGGDTLFASMYAAYDALSDRMKGYLDGLSAVHDGEHVYRGTYANLGVADKPTYPSAQHPIVRKHPVTGRPALFVNRGFTKHIVGLPFDEGQAVLSYLFQHIENPLFQCRFRWESNSVAFWDNRCVQHRALWDYWPNLRSGYRVTVSGDEPIAYRL